MNSKKVAFLALIFCLATTVFTARASHTEEINSVDGIDGKKGLLAIVERKVESVTRDIAPGVTATTKESADYYLFFVLDNKRGGGVFENSGTVFLEGETVRPFVVGNCLAMDVDIGLNMEPPASKAFYERVTV